MNKLFIVGLPRTGTTSLCGALLELGYGVAHTAYTDLAFERADVVADTPVFSEYKQLDRVFPNSKFIHLSRPLEKWLPSIQSLLARLNQKHEDNVHAFHPVLNRCYEAVFGRFIAGEVLSDEFLSRCFLNHQKSVEAYFCSRPNDFLSIDISDSGSYNQLLGFLSSAESRKPVLQLSSQLSSLQKSQLTSQGNPLQKPNQNGFPHLNSDGQISAWDKIKHPLKVNSNLVEEGGRRSLTCLG